MQTGMNCDLPTKGHSEQINCTKTFICVWQPKLFSASSKDITRKETFIHVNDWCTATL